MTEDMKELLKEEQKKHPHQDLDQLIERLALAYGRTHDGRLISKCEEDIKSLLPAKFAKACLSEAKSRSKKYSKAKYIGQWSAQW